MARHDTGTSLATVQSYLTQHKAQIAAALPKHLTPDRMARLALTAMSQSRKLAECDPKSLFGSVIVASQLGLEIGVGGHGFLVPYKGQATFVPGWQGIVDLVARAGRATVWTGTVFEGDAFDFALGDSPFVNHKPCGESDPCRMTHVYAIGRVKGSDYPIIEVWPERRVWQHRDRYNKVGKGHYSFVHPEMYARKVVLLQVIKYMPRSIEITASVELSHRVDQGRHATLDGDFMVVDDEVPKGEAHALTGQIRRKPADAKADPPSLADVVKLADTATNLDELATAESLVGDLPSDVHGDVRPMALTAIDAARERLSKESVE